MNEVNESLLNQWAKPTRLTRSLNSNARVPGGGQSKCGPGHWASPSEPYEIGKMQQSDSKIEKYALHNDGVIVLLN